MLARVGVLMTIAVRSLFTHWLNLLIGFLILAGTVLVVVGGALLDSLDRSMSSSIIGSVAGDAQVYSTASKDKLEVFPGFGGNDPDLAPITDFPRAEAALRALPNVREVVPMGIKGAMLTSGNTIDLILSRLREEIRQQQAGDRSTDRQARVDSLVKHVRHIVALLQTDMKNAQILLSAQGNEDRDNAAIARASEPEFWEHFAKDPLDGLEFLENKIAPLLTDGDLIYIRYLGTDLEVFQRTFHRMRIVRGTAVPPGHRGFLFARGAYEDNFKLKTAWRLDRIKDAIENSGRKIAEDDELKRWVRENMSQTREIALQLDPVRTKQAIERLQRALHRSETELEPLLRQLFDVNDQNFQERYAIFYGELGKDLLELYRVRVGESLTLSAFGRGGYVQSVNVKVYGVFQFDGLEKSPLGGFTNLMDMVTFRELYGYLSPERLEELKKLKEGAGAADVSREDAEQALFGQTGSLAQTTQEAAIDEDQLLERKHGRRREGYSDPDQTYTPEDMRRGIVLNAAVMLKDPSRLEQSLVELRSALQAAGLQMNAISWQEAAGMIGQFVRLARIALYIFVGIIFVVTLVIINNAMMMATLQRVRRSGTLRAIGARRGFVLAQVCVETVMLGIAFGGLGLLTASGIMSLLHRYGIGARTEELYFFFSGPRLFPTLGVDNLIAGFVIVLVVSLVSTLYPALIATRVSPLQAMQSEE